MQDQSDFTIEGRLRQALQSWDYKATPTLDGFLQDIPRAAQELKELIEPHQNWQELQPMLEA